MLSLPACAPADRAGAAPEAASGNAPGRSNLARGDVPTLAILGAYRWRLDAATDAAGRRIDVMPPGTTRPPVFGFSDAGVAIEGSCNRMNGRVGVDAESRMSVGRLASTMKACDPASMRADSALTDLLARPLRVDLVRGAQPRLRLVTQAGETLAFTGEPTPETRYGPGTTMFLEIAAERIACNRPLMPAATCLQVRERRFDAQGLAAGPPGEWRPMYESIDGYTHHAGERNVVRVKRYTRNPAPADASSFVYVLDLVVETEIVRR